MRETNFKFKKTPVIDDGNLNIDLLSSDTLPVEIIGGNKTIKFNHLGFRKVIYQSILVALSSPWFKSLSELSKKNYYIQTYTFSEWLNSALLNNDQKLETLNLYEAFRVNDCKTLTQSTGLSNIIKLINEGKSFKLFDTEDIRFLENLLNCTRVSPTEERTQVTLTSFFGQMPWLRQEIGEKKFLLLESPRLLVESFSITVATMLIILIESKKKIKNALKASPQIGADDKNLYRDILNHFGMFENGIFKDEIVTNLLLHDLVKKAYVPYIAEQLKKNDLRGLVRMPGVERIYRAPYRKPSIFEVNKLDLASELEEYLAAWLCAWQMIQGSDIQNLKKEHFTALRNIKGRLISIQCTYFKTRAARVHEPPSLDSTSIECKALYLYLERLKENEALFKFDISTARSFQTSSIEINCFGLLANYLATPTIFDRINFETKKRKASNNFIIAYTAAYLKSDESYFIWDNKAKREGKTRSAELYRKEVKKYLPLNMFSLTAIKNTAVHSRSDLYRANDLVNENSHTSSVESKHYLSAQNQEWKNREGRVNRMVFHDINNTYFQPNMRAIHAKASEMLLRTEIIQEPSINVQINVDGVAYNNEELTPDASDIVVIDSVETAIIMIHYTTQAKLLSSELSTNCPTFYEKTVLPTHEWMESVLSEKLSPKIVRSAYKEYKGIKDILPNLFAPQLFSKELS